MLKKIFSLSIITLAFVSCKNGNNTNNEDGLSAFNADTLVSYIKVLASDSFQGRKPFTEGETKPLITYSKNINPLD